MHALNAYPKPRNMHCRCTNSVDINSYLAYAFSNVFAFYRLKKRGMYTGHLICLHMYNAHICTLNGPGSRDYDDQIVVPMVL